MNESCLIQSRLINAFKSFALICLMAALLGFLAYIIAGSGLAVFIFVFIGVAWAVSPNMAPKFVMKFFKARPLTHAEAPRLYKLLATLSQRAGLENVPELYLVPNNTQAAFATGDSRKSAIAISGGLLNRLEPLEVAAVAAHEISHIRNNDMRNMWFALMISRVTDFLSMAGQLLLIINLPLILFNQVSISLVPIMILIFAPMVSYLVQMSLSRVNEFNADLGSAELMGSPQPLISALVKIEQGQRGLLRYLLPGHGKNTQSSLFRTHPPTEERIRRLKDVWVETMEPPITPFEQNMRIVRKPPVVRIPAKQSPWFF